MDAPQQFPCIDHGARLKRIEASLGRIETCLIGDEEIGQKGLVKQVASHSHRIGRIERALIYVVGAAGGITFVWKVLVAVHAIG